MRVTIWDNLKLGYGGTKSEMERLIADANAWGAANGGASNLSIDSFSDVVTAIQQIQQAQNIAGTTAKEAGTTIEGSINATKGAWSNLLAELGKDNGDVGARMGELMESIVGDGTDSNKGVLGNIAPRIATIISTVISQLPSALSTLGPQVGQSVMTILDGATGGLATQAMTALEPVTSAIGNALQGAFGWFQANQGTLSAIGGQIASLAGTIMSGLGSAINFIAPILGNIASAVLPVLSAGLNLLQGAWSAVSSAVGAFVTAISPVVEAVAPIATAIGETLCQAISGLGDMLSQVDFGPFGEAVATVFGGVADVISTVWDAITGFFNGIGDFIQDPIGTIQNGFNQLMGGADATSQSVSGSFAALQGNVDASTQGMRGSIQRTNSTPLNSKHASFTADGNVISGTARSETDKARDSIGKLKGNDVEVKARGNVIDGGAKREVNLFQTMVDQLRGNEVTVTENRVTNYITNREGGSASGAMIPRYAQGFIATQAMMTDIGWIGEDGAEAVTSWAHGTAVVPLTNKRYTGPFASEISSQVIDALGGKSSGGTTYNITVEGGSDQRELADNLVGALRAYELTHGRS